MPRATFSQIVNRSMSEVLVRSLITGLSSSLLVICLLVFGGETLRDFAFALLVGILSGTYSSIFIASPVLTHWKERERTFRARADRIRGESGGRVPAYAGGAGDVEPVAAAQATPRLTQPSRPGEISRAEFDELVRMQGDGEGEVRRDAFGRPVVDADGDGVGTARRPSRTTSTRAAKPAKPKRPRNRRHGRNR